MGLLILVFVGRSGFHYTLDLLSSNTSGSQGSATVFFLTLNYPHLGENIQLTLLFFSLGVCDEVLMNFKQSCFLVDNCVFF